MSAAHRHKCLIRAVREVSQKEDLVGGISCAFGYFHDQMRSTFGVFVACVCMLDGSSQMNA